MHHTIESFTPPLGKGLPLPPKITSTLLAYTIFKFPSFPIKKFYKNFDFPLAPRI